jgi:hypothetical protein
LVTRTVVWVVSTAQPATKREKASITAQQWIVPSRVGCSVMSVIHSPSGASRVKATAYQVGAVAAADARACVASGGWAGLWS